MRFSGSPYPSGNRKYHAGYNLPTCTGRVFNVFMDQLMGIVPLDEEKYIKEKTGTGQFWENKLEYLRRTRKNS